MRRALKLCAIGVLLVIGAMLRYLLVEPLKSWLDWQDERKRKRAHP